jgi:hypothetical protein
VLQFLRLDNVYVVVGDERAADDAGVVSGG